MPVNPYLTSFMEINEQDLVDSLTQECIQINGLDLLYLPRKLMNPDLLFGEDPTSEFDKGFEIEMYLENPQFYGGPGQMFSKFGLEIRKSFVFMISVQRFKETIANQDYPKEGDWLWHPKVNKMLEITFVDDEPIYWQLGRQYVYKIYTDLADYSHEKVDTGFDDADSITTTFYNDASDSNGLVNDGGAQNDDIKEIGSDYTDFSEDNPFGEKF